MTQNLSIPLSLLQPGDQCEVVEVQAQGQVRQRLLEMGFIRGDPMELVIKGYHLSLRRDESSCILVQRMV